MKRQYHGLSLTKAHTVWAGIAGRCYNPRNRAYVNYGGRGIKVCEKWQTFRGFYEDMGDVPEGMTLDRIDNDGDYSPENCRWADRKTQSRNRRGRRMATSEGVTRPLWEWAEITGISIGTLWQRLAKGWSEQEAITTPLVRSRKGIGRGESLRPDPVSWGTENGVQWSGLAKGEAA